MTILLLEEFNAQSQAGSNSLERIYQGKSVEGGPIFSMKNLQAANLYCQRFSKKYTGTICIVVKTPSYFRVWSEVSKTETDLDNNTKSTEAEIPINYPPILPEFVHFCQQLLADEIGPIAKTLCKKTLAKKPHLSRTEFVDILATKIADPTLAEKFRQTALE